MPIIITGNGAVGSPFKKLIRSGRAKKPWRTKKRNDILFRVLISVNDIVPIIRKIIPITNNPTTRANVLNIIIASSDGLLPNASLTSVNLNSGDIIERKRGNPWRKIKEI